MGLISGKSDIEANLDEAVDEAKQQVDQVSVEKMRSPKELFEQVDRLEEVVNGLRERQRRLAKNHFDDMNEAEIDESIDISALEQEIESVREEGTDLSGVEERLEMLEIAVNRLEAGFEMSAEELRENIIEEAEAIDKQELETVEQKIEQLESELKESEIEEKVDKSELEELIKDVGEQKSQIDGVQDKLNSLEIGQNIIKSGVDSEAEDLRELLVEELTSTYDHRISEIEDRLQYLTEELGFEEVNNVIDRNEVEEKISQIEEERKGREENLQERLDNINEKLADSRLEEKVDRSHLESEVSRLEETIQRLVNEKESRLRDDMASREELEESIDSLKEKEKGKVSREEFNNMKKQMEQMSELLLKVAHREREQSF